VSTYGVRVVETGLMVRYYRINLRLRRLIRQQQSDITNDISLDDGYDLLGRKLEVFGQPLIKNEDELDSVRWSVAVAEHAASKVKQALEPSVSELQLWALLNYTNLANNGDWHDGRRLASVPRINPWLQEVSARRVESGDLMGFDTDMIGPMGCFADMSRTFHCELAKPTQRQK
jgi:hypothetical protein